MDGKVGEWVSRMKRRGGEAKGVEEEKKEIVNSRMFIKICSPSAFSCTTAMVLNETRKRGNLFTTLIPFSLKLARLLCQLGP
jgi:hypothetical protein